MRVEAFGERGEWRVASGTGCANHLELSRSRRVALAALLEAGLWDLRRSGEGTMSGRSANTLPLQKFALDGRSVGRNKPEAKGVPAQEGGKNKSFQ